MALRYLEESPGLCVDENRGSWPRSFPLLCDYGISLISRFSLRQSLPRVKQVYQFISLSYDV
jgi:hypothetical protein